ncbi:hypothetical protein [Pseudactinotalea terrae]|uniref:hypothetical protein n=1 Tax=Pseudactinotalea terrae TaxID=1743262 RepID=UPI0012E198B8|nr:hypothetical protein [Pseudactinotalea terrae]
MVDDWRRHTEAISALEAIASDYERIVGRREKSGVDSTDALLVGSRQVAAELRESIRVLNADLGIIEPAGSAQPRTSTGT